MNFKTLSVQPLLNHSKKLEQLIIQGRACQNTYSDYLACQHEIKRRCGEQEACAHHEPPQTIQPPKARFAFFNVK